MKWPVERNKPLQNIVVLFATRLIFKKLEQAGIETLRIQDVARTTSGGTPSRSISEYFEGNIPWLKSAELNDSFIYHAEEHITEDALENSSAKIFPKGTLLVALYGATTGKTGILGIEAATNQAICAVFPQRDIERDYLHWYFRMKRQDFLISSYGGAQPNISQKTVNESSILIPSPQIQKKVASFLNALSSDSTDLNRIEMIEPLTDIPKKMIKIRNIMKKTEELRRLSVKAMEESELLVFSARHNLIFPKKANRWKTLVFDKAVNKLRGPRSGLLKKKYNSSGKFPVIDQGKEYVGGYTDDESRVFEVTEPVIVWGDHTTNSKLVDFNFVPGADGTKIFSPKEELLVEYVNQFLKAINYPEMGYSRHYRYLKKQQIPLPPFSEQCRIVAYLDSLQEKVDELKKLQDETEKKIEELIPSILDKAFKGEL